MKIQFVSDLHLDFRRNREYMILNPIEKGGDILILAGDIYDRPVRCENNDFFLTRASLNFDKTFWLVGNHEFWDGKDYAKYEHLFEENITDTITIINNKSVVIDDITIIFSMMWSELNPIKWGYLQTYHGDFEAIKYHGKVVNFDIYNNIHHRALNFIKSEVENAKTKKIVVVTHHCPYSDGNGPKYKDSNLSSGFTVALDRYIEKSGIDYWIHGHTHYNHPDIKIGKTIVTCNQLGYCHHGEKDGYLNNKTIKL